MTQNNELPNGFKMTELGPLPEGWDVVRLGELFHSRCLMVNNGFPCGKHFLRGRGIPHIRPFNITTEGQIKLETIKYVETSKNVKSYLLRPGDIIFNNTNSEKLVGKTAYWNQTGNFVLSNHMTIIRILDSEVLDPFFLSKFLHKRWYDGYYRSICRRHVNQASISLARLSDIFIPLPPLSEQKKIAAVLSSVQEAREKTEAVIQATKELKKSTMKYLFTYGPVPPSEADSVPLKETEIGMVPERWEVVKIRNVVIKTEQKDMRKIAGKFKYIDVSSIDRESLRIVSATIYQGNDAPSRARKIVKENDVIVATVRPTLKRLALIPKEYDNQVCSTAFCVLRGNDTLSNHYLYYAVQRDSFIAELGKIQRGASYPAVTDSDIKEQIIPFPPLPEQRRIAALLSSIDDKIQAEENKKKSLDDLFKRLLNDLMTAKIRVNNLNLEVS